MRVEGRETIIRQIPEDSDKNEEANIHLEAVKFVERHRDFFERYARGAIKIEPAPTGLNTFGFDLETNTIYINSKFYEQLGLSDEKTVFATLHEIEHFLEKAAMVHTKGGQEIFADYLAKIKRDRAFGLLDNCVADIHENRSIIKRTSGGMIDLERGLYREDLFKETDFTNEPKHIQFSQAILREHRVSGEVCQVAPEVREKLDQLYSLTSPKGHRIIDVMTSPNVPMSLRLALQEEFIEPLMRELLEKDMEEERSRQNHKGDNDGESADTSGNDKVDPNKVFKDAYNRADKKVLNAVPIEKAEDSFKKWAKTNKEGVEARADNEYAKGIDVKAEDLRRYRDIVSNLENIINPETGEGVVEELRKLIERIIAHRTKPAISPRYPVEEGDELVDPSMLVSEVKAGNLEPKVWGNIEIKDRKGPRFGEVEITLICDRSGSMNNPASKLVEQRKATVLLMEALKEFADRAREAKIHLEKSLEVRSEIYTFQRDLNKDGVPIKKMSSDLGEKERIDIFTAISSAPGGTTDFVPLETINSHLSEEDRKKITEEELKKIVIIFTDGESDDPSRVKRILKTLRESGVITIGVGVTKSGEAALTTYAPEARLAEKAEDLTIILADLLKNHLQDI